MIWRRRKPPETPMELYARMETAVYAHVKGHDCGCVIAWDVKAEHYVELIECALHNPPTCSS